MTATGCVTAIPHCAYAEAFIGMGGVFFRRTLRPAAETINDFNGEVANLFRILQRHYPQFMDTLKWQISSRREFERLLKVDPATLTDLESAARFLYLQRLSYGGKVDGRSFGTQTEAAGRFDLTRLAPMLEEVHERLAGVTIECLDYKEFLARYDSSGTLFYLDPPYYGCESDYGRALFSRAEFPKMAAALAGLQGKFILSLNDTPAVRDIFSAFAQRPVETRYSLATDSTKKVDELLISNFEGVMLHAQSALL